MFRLAVTLANRLTYKAKFAVIGALVAVLIVFQMAQSYRATHAQTEFTESELRGLHYSDRLRPLIVHMQQHRGLAAVVLNGNESKKTDLAAKGTEIHADLQGIDTTDAKIGSQLKVSEQWKGLKRKTETLTSQVLSLDAAKSFQEHTTLIGELKDFLVELGDTSGLALDPDAESYYLIATLTTSLPDLIESMGQLRAKGSAALARGTLTDTERLQLLVIQQRIDHAAIVLDKNMRRVFAASPETKSALETLATSVHKDAATLSDTAGKKIITARNLDMPAAEFFAMATEAMAPGIKLWEAGLGQTEALLKARISRLERSLLISTGVVSLVAFLLLWIFVGFYRSVIEAISAMQAGAGRLAEGDLTTELEVHTQDELERVADAFNKMARKIRNLISAVSANADKVAVSAAQVATSADQISRATHDQSEATATTAASIEEVTVSIDQVATKSGDAASLSRNAHDSAVGGEQIMRNTAGKMASIAESMVEVAGRVSTVDAQSMKIGGIINVIKDIADQTNLLALNAAIEAARAGEQGRGFAVVADEVRKLSERTASSTVEIASLIEEMQRNTKDMVSRIDASNGLVQEGVSYSTSASRALSDIRNGAQDAQGAIDDIALATREQSAAANEIACNVERIAQMTDETSSVMHATADSARDLDRLAGELRSMVGNFRV